MVKKLFILIMLILFKVGLFSIELNIEVIDRDLDITLEGVLIRNIDTDEQIYTDINGKCILDLPDNSSRAVIIAELIGYEPRKQLVTDLNNPLKITLLMEGVLEGEELVVEVETIGETDEEVGISTVIEKEIVKSAAKIGVIEDVMNAVRILPGVSYSGGFGSPMSVRGGDPSGFTAVLDGFVVKYPNHWGGAFSIFNPNIVESVKFSPGIFSVKHGQATSALLEVNTVDPTDGLKYSGILSTSTLEAFGQIPIGKNNNLGILTGFRLTNYDLAIKAVKVAGKLLNSTELTDTIAGISRAPYIYDFYLKMLYSPSEAFTWHLNGFWGNDGIGVENIESGDKTKEISNGYEFFYNNSDLFLTTGLKMLPTSKLLFGFTIGYENWEYEIDGYRTEEGYRDYSQDFLTAFPNIDAKGYEIFTETGFKETFLKESIQGRLDLDWSIHDNYLLQLGLGTTLDISSRFDDGEIWNIVPGKPSSYESFKFDSKSQDEKTLLSFAYTNIDAQLIPNLLKMDLGLRLDHAYFMGENGYSLNTYPELSPRLNFSITPGIRNSFFRENSFSIGSGIFNKNPFSQGRFDDDFSVGGFKLKSEKSLTSVIGWETKLPLDYRLKVEGYYKYIYDRFYYNTIVNPDNSYESVFHYDGFGHAVGGDILVDKKLSRYLDGIFSYTYVYARYKEPELDSNSLNTIYGGNKIRGEYYYPAYHRFHTLKLLLNIKPTNKFTFTTKLAFATGNPRNETGEISMFAASVTDKEGNPQIAEMYTRSSYYSETLRSNYVLPLDFKFSWHNYFKEGKYQWEIYFALEDALAPLLTMIQPSNSAEISKWDGGNQEASSSDFSFPIPSVGFSMSF